MKHIAPEDFVIAKPDLSLRGLIAWLEIQPADKAYIHSFGDKCLLGQWLRFVDPESVWMRDYVYFVSGENRGFHLLKEIACGRGPKDWTFGAALARARVRLS